MTKELLRGRKEIMDVLKISNLRTFYRVMKHLPIRRIGRSLVAERNELIDHYLRLGHITETASERTAK